MSGAGEGLGRAKVILFGEHSVVHGQPALAGALDVGVKATARSGGGPRVRIPEWDVDTEPTERGDDLTRAMARLFAKSQKSAHDARVVAEPKIPGRVGLGSSAALSVAVVRALADLGGEELSFDEVEARVGLAEEVFHGRASGIDAAVATRGGVLGFHRGTPPSSVKCASLPIVVALIQSRVPTRQMVDRVSGALEARPEAIGALFREIGDVVHQAQSAIERDDLGALGRLMNKNHRLLQELDVSTPALDNACQAARGAGAVGAKLTGAGGGGCMIALAPGREDEVHKVLKLRARWVTVARLGRG